MGLHKTMRMDKKQILKFLSVVFVLCLVGMLNLAMRCTSDKEDVQFSGLSDSAWAQVNVILKKIVPPNFPDRDFNITNYGAVADGNTLNTKAFEKAIEACSGSGGGRVVVPPGEFLTGAIHLKNNVNLYISEGAVVKFSTDPRDYLPIVLARWEGVDLMNYSPLIYALEKENVAVTGKGLLDGQGSNDHWWPWKGKKEFGSTGLSKTQDDSLSRPRLMKMNDENMPVNKRIFGEGTYLRPTFVEFYKCKNILIEGVTFKDAPFWFIHPVLSANITVSEVTINGLGPNNDGCDPESCTDVLIDNCTFNNGDDCIAIKSGRNGDGRRINIPSSNIIIRNCKMKDGHGGIVIGSEISGGCSNVFAEKCEMDSPNLERALRIKTNSKRGGIIRGIYMRDVKVGQVKDAVVKINMRYEPLEAEGFNYNPECENVFVQNVKSRKSKYGIFLDGLEGSEIKNIVIEDCVFNGVSETNYVKNVVGLKLKNVYINGKLQNENE